MANKDNILITGASSDIGIQLISEIIESHQFKENLIRIIALVNNGSSKLENLLGLTNEKKDQIVIIKADFHSEEELCSVLESIESSYGAPNKIIHLAAKKLELVRAKDFEWSSFSSDLEIQLKSISLILKKFLPKISRLKKKSKIIFVLSSCVLGQPPKYMIQYTTVKYALHGYMRSLVEEYAGKNISFNAISPSMIETQFLINIPEKYIELAASSRVDGKNATVRDVTPVLRFLLSEDSDYLNGVNIPLSAGQIF